MYLEVAPQTKSGDTDSGTVGALEFGSGHWRYSIVVGLQQVIGSGHLQRSL